MSKFPRLNLRSLSQKKKSEPPLATVPVVSKKVHNIRYIFFIFITFVLGSCMILFIPSGSIRHMKRLKCKMTMNGYICDGYSYGEIIVKSSDRCMNDMFDINGLPFNVARRKTIFRAPSSEKIIIHDAALNCHIEIFHDTREIIDVHGFTWITTSDHTEFTVYDGSDILLDRISTEFIEHQDQGKWIAYTYDQGTDVSGNGNTPIYIFNY